MRKFYIIFVGFLFFYLTFSAAAFERSTFSDTPISDDFLIQPAKFELFLNSEESATRDFFVINRLDIFRRISSSFAIEIKVVDTKPNVINFARHH